MRASISARSSAGTSTCAGSGELAARGLDREVSLSRRHPEALGDELEVVDQSLHRGGELVARRQGDLAVGSDEAPLRQPVQSLIDDLQRLAHLGQAAG